MKKTFSIILFCLIFSGCVKTFETPYGAISFQITPEMILKIYDMVVTTRDFQSGIIQINGIKIAISDKEQYIDSWGNADFCLSIDELNKLKSLSDSMPDDFIFKNKLGTILLIKKGT